MTALETLRHWARHMETCPVPFGCACECGLAEAKTPRELRRYAREQHTDECLARGVDTRQGRPAIPCECGYAEAMREVAAELRVARFAGRLREEHEHRAEKARRKVSK
jgi:hypothetical protein